jgi:hypothetical protein
VEVVVPRYYFDLADHDDDEDDVGVELENADAARVEAVVFAGDYLRDNPGLVWDGTRFSVRVRDEDGRRLYSVEVSAKEPET